MEKKGGGCFFENRIGKVRDMQRNSGGEGKKRFFPIFRSRFFAILLALTALFLTACSGSGHPAIVKSSKRNKILLQYGVLGDKDEQSLQMAKRFAKEVKEKSHGRIEIKIISPKDKGNEMALFEQFKNGNLDMVRLSLSSAKKISPKLSLLELPYLFNSEEEMWNVLDGEKGALFQEDFRSKGMELLVWNCLGFRDFYTVERPILSVEDFEGLVLGVEDESRMGMALQLLSGKTREVSANKLYKALQSGVVDGSENTLEEFAVQEHSSSAKYFLEDEHSPVLDLQLLSPKAKENMSEEDLDLIKELAFSMALQERAMGKKAKVELRSRLAKRGVMFAHFSQEEKQKLAELLAPLYLEAIDEEFMRKLGKIA